MGLISQKHFTETVPGEEATITFKLLSIEGEKKARQKKQQDSMALISGIDLSSMRDMKTPEREPIDDYDIQILLEESIVSWSYGVAININELDRQTARWAAELVVEKNGLGEKEVDRKNGSVPSIVR